MPNCDPNSPFAVAYDRIARAAKEHRVVDYQDASGVDYRIDLNTLEGLTAPDRDIDDFPPELILCMETLEHVNYHFECLNLMARAVRQYRSTVFLTVPNNGNWLFNALGWNEDHSVAFLRDIALRFVSRSDSGRHTVEQVGCVQEYLWYWWIAHILSLFQPFSWDFLVTPSSSQ